MPHPFAATFNRILGLGCLLFIGIATAGPLFAQGDPEMVALVNGAIIYRSELDAALERHYAPLKDDAETDAGEDPQGVRQMLLENLIDRRLLLQEARRQGLSVSDARVLRRMEQLPEPLRPKAGAGGGDAATGEADDLFGYVQEGMLIERLLERELPQIGAVSEKRAKAFYEANAALFVHPEEVHLRHILVKISPEMTADERQQAYLRIQAVEQQLAEGGNFTTLAIDHSQCPSSVRGGDLGYLTRDQLYPTLAETGFDLVPGQVSRIVESPAGYHLLLASERRPARQLPFLLVREGLQKWLRAQRQQKAARGFIRGLRERASVERLLE